MEATEFESGTYVDVVAADEARGVRTDSGFTVNAAPPDVKPDELVLWCKSCASGISYSALPVELELPCGRSNE